MILEPGKMNFSRPGSGLGNVNVTGFGTGNPGKV
jgi:hypothetical protein